MEARPPIPARERPDAPGEAVILLGADGLEASAERRTARLAFLMGECARHGFSRILILGGADERLVAEARRRAMASPPRAEIRWRNPGGAPLARLAAVRDELAPAFLLLDENAALPANLLGGMPAFAGGALAVAGLRPAEDGSGGPLFLVEDHTARPILRGGRAEGSLWPFRWNEPWAGKSTRPHEAADAARPHALCGLALLTRAALEEQAQGIDRLLQALASRDALGAWPLSAAGPRESEEVRPRRPALFLDRDGTINVDHGYVYEPEKLELIPGAVKAVKRANDLGFYVFLVTNQSGVGRGYYREEDVATCNGALQGMLRAAGAHMDDVRYAIDHPDALHPSHRVKSGWRKPEPGMLTDLMARWPVDRARSLMVGDKDSDVEAGEAAGVLSLKFTEGDLDLFLAEALMARAV